MYWAALKIVADLKGLVLVVAVRIMKVLWLSGAAFREWLQSIRVALAEVCCGEQPGHRILEVSGADR
jgi:hypothetical protein